MIHYHGAEITPDTVAVKVFDGRHILISFAYPRQTEMISELSQSFAFDNGAFTVWRQGKEYDFNKFYLWVSEWFTHPGFDWALIPDVIDGKLSENKQLIKDWPFCKSHGVPVWHLNEPLHWLLELCQEFPRVAIGSSGEYADIGTDRWWHRMADIFHYICVDGRPISKIHGLRMLDPRVFTMFPFSSCDSANVARNHGDPSRLYRATEKKINHAVMLHNIEKQQSASELKGIPQQKGLFTP